MQAASPAAPTRRLRQRARLLVQGIDAAPAAEQTETGFDAGRVARRVQADRQSAVIVDAASPGVTWALTEALVHLNPRLQRKRHRARVLPSRACSRATRRGRTSRST